VQLVFQVIRVTLDQLVLSENKVTKDLSDLMERLVLKEKKANLVPTVLTELPDDPVQMDPMG